nr:hypothetical protein [Kofleriaceae bacterium]
MSSDAESAIIIGSIVGVTAIFLAVLLRAAGKSRARVLAVIDAELARCKRDGVPVLHGPGAAMLHGGRVLQPASAMVTPGQLVFFDVGGARPLALTELGAPTSVVHWRGLSRPGRTWLVFPHGGKDFGISVATDYAAQWLDAIAKGVSAAAR